MTRPTIETKLIVDKIKANCAQGDWSLFFELKDILDLNVEEMGLAATISFKAHIICQEKLTSFAIEKIKRTISNFSDEDILYELLEVEPAKCFENKKLFSLGHLIKEPDINVFFTVE